MIHKRQVGESKKGHNAIYGLHFAGVIARTWWRERVASRWRRAGQPAAGDLGAATAVPSAVSPPAAGEAGGGILATWPTQPARAKTQKARASNRNRAADRKCKR